MMVMISLLGEDSHIEVATDIPLKAERKETMLPLWTVTQRWHIVSDAVNPKYFYKSYFKRI